MDFHEIDPTKLDFKLETKDLHRQIVLTVTSLDDETFKALADFAVEFKELWKKELTQYKIDNNLP